MKKNEAISILATSARPREPKNRKKYDEAVKMAINALNEPERKKGKWIKISPANIYECSECGKNVMTHDIDAYDFCHGCGADMREGKE